jgi:hypothetical protein
MTLQQHQFSFKQNRSKLAPVTYLLGYGNTKITL